MGYVTPHTVTCELVPTTPSQLQTPLLLKELTKHTSTTVWVIFPPYS